MMYSRVCRRLAMSAALFLFIVSALSPAAAGAIYTHRQIRYNANASRPMNGRRNSSYKHEGNRYEQSFRRQKFENFNER
ncbi:MAG: hypothetical protein MPL62_00905 [Alphaproteobacteria bacterium]|nr:hypothetical protein [Alphaproteobacteria bacterium]